MITILYAHPYSRRSNSTKALLAAVQQLSQVHVRNLYEMYPDFHIDVEAEQSALNKARTLVLLHPLFWYHMPALLSLWCEKVLSFGWAYGLDAGGNQARALAGKRMMWAISVGGTADSFTEENGEHYSLAQLAAPIRQSALLCGLNWLTPYTLYNAITLGPTDLLSAAEAFRDRIVDELKFLRAQDAEADHAG